jgi:small-conductance mechanosensitive channel
MGCLVATTLASFFLAKKFINTEFDKYDRESYEKFDAFVILIAGLILLALIMAIGIAATNLLATLLHSKVLTISSSFRWLLIILPSILVVGHVFMSPNHGHLRFFEVLDEEVQLVCRKLLRVVCVSLVIIMCAYVFMATLRSQYITTCAYFFSGLLIFYYIMEIFSFRRLIEKSLAVIIREKYRISAKLAMFINKRFGWLLAAGMIAIAVSNYSVSKVRAEIFFSNACQICLFLLYAFVAQYVIVRIINKFLSLTEDKGKGKSSSKLSQHRNENLEWVCDVFVMSIYFVIVCCAANVLGYNIKKHILHDKTIVLALTIFVSIIIHKIFKEFIVILNEKASFGKDEHYKKFRTFLPIISVVFSSMLFIIATIIALANFGINIGPILAAFSIFSAAIGLAAKDIIQGFLHGIILLMENSMYVGELVKINDTTGRIEALSVRIMQLRAIDGSVHTIPYNLINSIVNFSREYVYVVDSLHCEAQDLPKICDILKNLTKKMQQEPEYCDVILGDVVIHGLEPFDMTGIKVFWTLKISASAIATYVKYAIYMRLIDEFKQHGIEIPVAKNLGVYINHAS